MFEKGNLKTRISPQFPELKGKVVSLQSPSATALHAVYGCRILSISYTLKELKFTRES